MTDKEKIKAEIKRRIIFQKECIKNSYRLTGKPEEEIILEYKQLLSFIDSMQEEPVSEDLEEAAAQNANSIHTGWIKAICIENFKDGAQWQKEKEYTCYEEAFEDGAKWQKEKDESVTKDLEEYINELSKQFPEVSFAKLSRIAVRVAKWQEEHLWKPADGDDLPEIDREVVVLTQPYPLENSEYAVSFAHRPNPNGWDGKSITTGKVEHFVPQTYGDGGWNIPNIVYWLDVELPKEIEL